MTSQAATPTTDPLGDRPREIIDMILTEEGLDHRQVNALYFLRWRIQNGRLDVAAGRNGAHLPE